MRRARLAKIHIARKQLAMADDSYRALLHRITGKDTSAALDIVQLDAVLQEFKRLGFHGGAPRRWRAPSQKPHVRKVFALWHSLRPYLNDRSDAALRSFVRRQTRSELHPEGISDPAFLNPEDANLVIEGLKAWLKRAKSAAKTAEVAE
jgi:phage gp16-like protein